MSMNIGPSWNYLNPFLVQESITLMFVALGLAIIGIGYARIKTKEFFQLHRWIMSGATVSNPGIDFFCNGSILIYLL